VYPSSKTVCPWKTRWILTSPFGLNELNENRDNFVETSESVSLELRDFRIWLFLGLPGYANGLPCKMPQSQYAHISKDVYPSYAPSKSLQWQAVSFVALVFAPNNRYPTKAPIATLNMTHPLYVINSNLNHLPISHRLDLGRVDGYLHQHKRIKVLRRIQRSLNNMRRCSFGLDLIAA
jgi:hypothetical protein